MLLLMIQRVFWTEESLDGAALIYLPVARLVELKKLKWLAYSTLVAESDILEI